MWMQQAINSFAVIFVNLCFSAVGQENLGQCFDPECSKPIALGVTNQNHARLVCMTGEVFLKADENVNIYVRNCGKKQDFYGIKFRDKKGYMSKIYIKEMQVLEQNLVPAKIRFADGILQPDANNSHKELKSSTESLHPHDSVSSNDLSTKNLQPSDPVPYVDLSAETLQPTNPVSSIELPMEKSPPIDTVSPNELSKETSQQTDSASSTEISIGTAQPTDSVSSTGTTQPADLASSTGSSTGTTQPADSVSSELSTGTAQPTDPVSSNGLSAGTIQPPNLVSAQTEKHSTELHSLENLLNSISEADIAPLLTSSFFAMAQELPSSDQNELPSQVESHSDSSSEMNMAIGAENSGMNIPEVLLLQESSFAEQPHLEPSVSTHMEVVTSSSTDMSDALFDESLLSNDDMKPEFDDQVSDSGSELTANSIIADAFSQITETNVKKAVVALETHNTDSQHDSGSVETDEDEDIDNIAVDSEMQKTLDILVERGENLTEILNEQISASSTSDNAFQYNSAQNIKNSIHYDKLSPESYVPGYPYPGPPVANQRKLEPSSNQQNIELTSDKELKIAGSETMRTSDVLYKNIDLKFSTSFKKPDEVVNGKSITHTFSIFPTEHIDERSHQSENIATPQVTRREVSSSDNTLTEASHNLHTSDVFKTYNMELSSTYPSADAYTSTNVVGGYHSQVEIVQNTVIPTDHIRELHASKSDAAENNFNIPIVDSQTSHSAKHVDESSASVHLKTDDIPVAELSVDAHQHESLNLEIDIQTETEKMVSSGSKSEVGAQVSNVDMDSKKEDILESAGDKDWEFESEEEISDDDDDNNNDESSLPDDNHVPPQRQILQDSSSTDPEISTESFTEETTFDDVDTKVEDDREEPGIFSISSILNLFQNSIASLRSILDYIILLVPEPIYAYIDSSGISARAVVFTAIVAFPLALLFLATFFVKERSKEQMLVEELRDVEHKIYLATAERDILRDETKNLKHQLSEVDSNLSEEKNLTSELQKRLQEMEFINRNLNSELKANISIIKELQSQKDEYLGQIHALKSTLAEAQVQNDDTSRELSEAKGTIDEMSEEIYRLKDEANSLSAEIERNGTFFSDAERDYNEKIMKLEEGCSQLLIEAGVWNTKVNELTDLLAAETSSKEELEQILKEKESEIESLKTAFTNMEAFQNMKDVETDDKIVTEKLQALIDVSAVQNKLKKREETISSLEDELKQEKGRSMDLKVELLEAQSEVDKLKTYYNHAIKEKEESQQKLEFFTEYFKEKEVQLQKELGLQEVVRQKKEKDATHAERHIHLIEKENESYKYQIETLKKEIEETERNLKNQIATQEKKAHENWLAARAAERKTEEMKQETVQLRQRLTLLEREQESWMNSSQGDIVRPVAQRISDVHDMSEGSLSSEFLPKPLPGMPEDMPLPMRPGSRPMFPPGGPPMPLMAPPPFMPPFEPMMPLPPRPHPWRMMPEKHYDSDRRNTPSDFDSRKHHHTPPYYESDRRSLSPVDGNRSRGSSPPEVLPDFHNVPPPMQRHPDFPPGPPSRFLPPPMHRLYKGVPPPRTGNPRPSGNNGTRQLNDRDLRPQHTDADV